VHRQLNIRRQKFAVRSGWASWETFVDKNQEECDHQYQVHNTFVDKSWAYCKVLSTNVLPDAASWYPGSLSTNVFPARAAILIKNHLKINVKKFGL